MSDRFINNGTTYVLYVGHRGKASDRIVQRLRDAGVTFRLVKQDAPDRVLPALEWDDDLLEGTANIESYFLRYVMP